MNCFCYWFATTMFYCSHRTHLVLFQFRPSSAFNFWPDIQSILRNVFQVKGMCTGLRVDLLNSTFTALGYSQCRKKAYSAALLILQMSVESSWLLPLFCTVWYLQLLLDGCLFSSARFCFMYLWSLLLSSNAVRQKQSLQMKNHFFLGYFLRDSYS